MSIADSLRILQYPTTEAEVKIVSEVAYNILYGIVPLTKEETVFFRENKPAIRKLVKTVSWNNKLKVLSQQLFEKLIVAALRHLDG